ncbi:MAG: hypothetical protein HN348_36595 [Proteobacteria bacterium]|nr:hypothetical protein [Pseudomonadota bacterium]
MEEGDIRGEFIGLWLAPELSAAAKSRLKQLCHDYGYGWGPLIQCLGTRRSEGFFGKYLPSFDLKHLRRLIGRS